MFFFPKKTNSEVRFSPAALATINKKFSFIQSKSGFICHRLFFIYIRNSNSIRGKTAFIFVAHDLEWQVCEDGFKQNDVLKDITNWVYACYTSNFQSLRFRLWKAEPIFETGQVAVPGFWICKWRVQIVFFCQLKFFFDRSMPHFPIVLMDSGNLSLTLWRKAVVHSTSYIPSSLLDNVVQDIRNSGNPLLYSYP